MNTINSEGLTDQQVFDKIKLLPDKSQVEILWRNGSRFEGTKEEAMIKCAGMIGESSMKKVRRSAY